MHMRWHFYLIPLFFFCTHIRNSFIKYNIHGIKTHILQMFFCHFWFLILYYTTCNIKTKKKVTSCHYDSINKNQKEILYNIKNAVYADINRTFLALLNFLHFFLYAKKKPLSSRFYFLCFCILHAFYICV